MNDHDQNYQWEKIWSCEDGLEAQLIKNLLEINDIPVKLMNINSNNIFPDTGIAKVDIYVPEELTGFTQKIIKENFE